MIKNTLFSSGQVVTLAVGQTYTVKDNEVFLNRSLYRKCDIEVALSNIYPTNQPNFIGVGIKKRNTLSNLPADLAKFNEWEIDGVAQTSLGACIENLTTDIYCSESTGGGGGVGGSITIADIVIESFVYNGTNNNFVLANTALKVLDVFIENGTYPSEVPNGMVTSVLIDTNLLLTGNTVTIKYIK